MEDIGRSTESIIMEALSSLTPSQLSDLIQSISSFFHLLHRRLHSILSVPTLFYLTLQHLQSLSLPEKSLLIARHLLSNLTILTTPVLNTTTSSVHSVKLRDLDAVALLLLLCELRQHCPEILEIHPSHWRGVLSSYYVSNNTLNLSGIEVSSSQILIKYVEMVTKCKRFVNAMCCRGKESREVATSVAIVVALPSVEVMSGGRECAICKEEMKAGRDVCKLPCNHLFHWMCILPWLRKRNTCPCCRRRLPTDDVFGEIERLWEILAKMGGNGCRF